MTQTRPPVSEIKARAIAMIGELARELAPDQGRVEGHRYWACNPTRADRSANSFCIDISGSTAGRWMEFAAGATAKDGEGGDVIDLVAYVLKGGSGFKTKEARGTAIAWLAQRVGLESTPRRAWSGGKGRKEAEAEAERARAFEAQRLAKDLDARAGKAMTWWLKRGLPAKGSAVELYLAGERGIPMHVFKRWPGAIRFLPESVDRFGEVHPPAMFCCMNPAAAGEGPGKIRAVHRTFITLDGRKDPEANPVRKIYGDGQGAAIRISNGGSSLSADEAARAVAAGDATKLKHLVIGESVEDMAIAALLWPERRVWAAATVGNMAAIAQRFGWPACASEITLLRDNDPQFIEVRGGIEKPGGGVRRHPADVALENAAKAFMAVSLGRPVNVARCLGAHDLNDLWRGVAA